MAFEVAPSVPYSIQAADIIRSRILRGDYKLGERLNEVEISSSLGISRSPIREALRTLAEEGLVRLVSGRGVFVASFPVAEIRELLELREALDVLAAQLAAARANAEDIRTLERCLDGLAVSHQSYEAAAPPATDFHLAILDIAGNSKLREVGRSVHTQIRLARFRSGAAGDRGDAAHAEHLAILEALRDHDGAEAEKRVRAHSLRGAEHILLTLAEDSAN
jgi:DNA-binding GntR family transcriptional regulator